MKIRILFFLIVTLNMVALGQTKVSEKFAATSNGLASNRIQWQKPVTIKYSDTKTGHFISFTGADYSPVDDFLPRYSQKIKIANGQQFTAEITNASYDVLSDEEVGLIKNSQKIGNTIIVTSNVRISRKQPFGVASFIPIRKNNLTGKYEKLVSFDLNIATSPSEKSGGTRSHVFSSHSVLQNGKWYKIAVTNDGIYKISSAFLRTIGMDVTTINPDNIRIYGNGGGMLPEPNASPRPDDLIENAIMVQTAVPGTFGSSDYILFYGKGPDKWTYNSASLPKFQHLV